MAHSLSAKKRIRQNLKRRMRNRARISAVRTCVKHYGQTIQQGSDVEAAEKELRLTQKSIDKLAAKRCIHKNTAARKKSKLARQLNALRSKTA